MLNVPITCFTDWKVCHEQFMHLYCPVLQTSDRFYINPKRKERVGGGKQKQKPRLWKGVQNGDNSFERDKGLAETLTEVVLEISFHCDVSVMSQDKWKQNNATWHIQHTVIKISKIQTKKLPTIIISLFIKISSNMSKFHVTLKFLGNHFTD